MKYIRFRLACCAALLILVATGCRQSNSASQSATPPRIAQPSPEESFELIFETFRRGIEDVPVGFVVEDEAGGHSMMTGKNEVSHKLIPPAQDGDPYKGIITVESESRYSVQRSNEEEETDSDQRSANQSDHNLASSGDEFGVEIFDPDLVSAPGAREQERRTAPGKSKKNEVTVARKEDKQVRDYELIYQDGRWRLTTKLNSNTEKSIQYAFERALESQS